MKKFEVKYSRKDAYTGIIEAESLEEAQKLWEDGYTPDEEQECNSGTEDLIYIKEKENDET